MTSKSLSIYQKPALTDINIIFSYNSPKPASQNSCYARPQQLSPNLFLKDIEVICDKHTPLELQTYITIFQQVITAG
jgi:hypothetical protein